jgi:membrane-bound ClpP family serine protease
MNAVILLFLAGLLLLAFEVFTPGAVLGVLGGIAMAAGCGVAFYRFGPAVGALTTVTAALLLGAMLWVELVVLPKTRLGQKLFQHQTIAAQSQPAVADPAAVVGKSADAVTALAPSGYVQIEGRRYESWSQSGYVPKGATVRVVGLDNFRLIVTQS